MKKKMYLVFYFILKRNLFEKCIEIQKKNSVDFLFVKKEFRGLFGDSRELLNLR